MATSALSKGHHNLNSSVQAMAPRTRSCSSRAAAMAPREGGASMASGMKSPLQTGDLHEVLAQLQESESIFFHKSLARSPNCKPGKLVQLVLPVQFIREHAGKFREWSFLRTRSSSRLWRVKFSIYLKSNGSPQVHMYAGWKEFVVENRLKEGDSLVFVLNDVNEGSVFRVYIYPGAGKSFSNPQIPVRIPRKRSHNISGSGENFPPEQTIKISTAGRYNLRSGGEGNTRETGPGHLLIEKEKALEERQENLGDGSFDHGKAPSSGYGMESQTSELRTESSQRRKKLASQHGTSSLPSFHRRLFHYHLEEGRIEVPGSFVRKHCMPGQLDNDVKLQGIHQESPVRIVRCQWRKSGHQMRLRFMTGWSSFRKENGLQADEVLHFTLTSDSFFVVRLV